MYGWTSPGRRCARPRSSRSSAAPYPSHGGSRSHRRDPDAGEGRRARRRASRAIGEGGGVASCTGPARPVGPRREASRAAVRVTPAAGGPDLVERTDDVGRERLPLGSASREAPRAEPCAPGSTQPLMAPLAGAEEAVMDVGASASAQGARPASGDGRQRQSDPDQEQSEGDLALHTATTHASRARALDTQERRSAPPSGPRRRGSEADRLTRAVSYWSRFGAADPWSTATRTAVPSGDPLSRARCAPGRGALVAAARQEGIWPNAGGGARVRR
jgi:hypothetical protein